MQKGEKAVNKQQRTLEELLLELEEEILKGTSNQRGVQRFSDKAYKKMKELGEREVLVVFDIVKLLLGEIMETGTAKPISKSELLRNLPWEKSRLSERLQKLVQEGILLQEKRKYLLNLDNPFIERVKRCMRFENQEIELEELLQEFSQEIKGIATNIDEEKEEQLEEVTRKIYREVTEEELKYFVEELYQTFREYYGRFTGEELEDELAMLFEKNILMTIGMVRREEER